ncbi:MAG: hypothetical protein ABIL09_17310 [Gemmatimonadota bacterium]
MANPAAYIREPSGVPRQRWPVTVGVPFGQGALRDPARLRLCGEGGEALPSSAVTLAAWADGSVKWALLDFQVDVGPMSTTRYALSWDGEPPAAVSGLRATVRDDCIDVVTGDLAVRLGRRGPRLLQSVSRGRREYLAWGTAADPGSDLLARSDDGALHQGYVDEAAIEESNPLRLVICARGGYTTGSGAAGDRLLSWIARLYFYAGHSFLRLYHTVLHDQPCDHVLLRQLRLHLPLALGSSPRAIFSLRQDLWDHGPVIDPVDGPVELLQWSPERTALRRPADPAAADAHHRVNADGWVHLAGSGAGVTAKVRRPWQNYPKAYGVTGHGLYVDLFPDLSAFARPGAGPGRTYAELGATGHVEYDGPLRLPQGMAKTHEVYLRFGAAAADGRAVDAFAIAAEQPLLLQLDPEYCAATGALGPLAPYRDQYWPLETELRRFCRPPNGLGLVNCGDQVRLEPEDGRVHTRTAGNLAYELPRALLRQYLRAGDQRLFWEGEAAVHHLLDVDTVHYSAAHPEWVGGPHLEWSQNHHYRDTDEDQLAGPHLSHTWLGSLLDYYFLTGYRRAREVAEACADYCRRTAPYDWKQDLTREARLGGLARVEPWPYSTRVVGWALTAMGTYYQAFPEARFLPAMEALVDLLEVWQDEEGRWRDQIGSHNCGAIPFMLASVLQGLQLYHAASGDERARRMLLDGARFLARHGRTVEGIFYYKESPISDTPHASAAMLLGPLAFAFEQSGDPELLDAGHRLFRWLVDGGEVATYMLNDIFAFMPLLDRLDLLAPYRAADRPAPARPGA